MPHPIQNKCPANTGRCWDDLFGILVKKLRWESTQFSGNLKIAMFPLLVSSVLTGYWETARTLRQQCADKAIKENQS